MIHSVYINMVLGAAVFFVLAPLLGLRLLPILVRAPDSLLERTLGALSIGLLVGTLIIDFVYRLLSSVINTGFTNSLAVSALLLILIQKMLEKISESRFEPTVVTWPWTLQMSSTISRIMIVGFAVVILITIFSPIVGNDQFEYFAVAEIWAEKGLKSYPPNFGSLNGLIVAPSSHPTAFHTLIAALFLPGLPVLFHIVYIAIFATTLLYISGFMPQPALYIAAFIGCPIFLSQFMSRSIDPLWLSGLMVGGLVLYIQCYLLTENKYQLSRVRIFLIMISSGIAITLMVGFHSIGLVAAMLLCGSLILWCRFSMRLITMLCFAIIISIPFFSQYILNMFQYGSPVQDSAPVLDLVELGFYSDLRLRRGLNSNWEGIWVGALRGFSDFVYFGVIPWLALLSGSLLLKHKNRQGSVRFGGFQFLVGGLTILFFIVTVLFQINLVVKNIRYWQLVLPSMAAVIGGGLKSGRDS